jgi:hypothetical protein
LSILHRSVGTVLFLNYSYKQDAGIHYWEESAYCVSARKEKEKERKKERKKGRKEGSRDEMRRAIEEKHKRKERQDTKTIFKNLL